MIENNRNCVKQNILKFQYLSYLLVYIGLIFFVNTWSFLKTYSSFNSTPLIPFERNTVYDNINTNSFSYTEYQWTLYCNVLSHFLCMVGLWIIIRRTKKGTFPKINSLVPFFFLLLYTCIGCFVSGKLSVRKMPLDKMWQSVFFHYITPIYSLFWVYLIIVYEQISNYTSFIPNKFKNIFKNIVFRKK